MNIKDARSISPSELEQRRKQAILLYKSGMSRSKIANVVGAHRNTVGQWVTDWKSGGEKALSVRAPGRPTGTGRKLDPSQEREIKRLLIDKHPEQMKLNFALWTREAVRDLIDTRFKINVPLRTITDYLRRWGFTPQKPVRRAYERNDKMVKKWLDEDYPKIVKEARKQGAQIHWGDETGLRTDDAKGRGFSLKGKKPVRHCKGTPEKINMISTVTNQGTLRFMFYKEKMSANVFIRFLRRLIKSAEKKIFLIVDNLRVHHSKVVKAWIEEHRCEISIFYLPSYSPDLNPDEFLNNDLKSAISKTPDSRKKGRLEKTARSKMKSIQKRPGRVQSYFQAKTIRYAA